MEYIARKEAALDKQTLHSFHPQELPEGFSRVPRNELAKQSDHDNHANDLDFDCRTMPEASRLLPCHYFDYICGTSTGGYVFLSARYLRGLNKDSLIAIMLGRFRMSVTDCIVEYKRVSEEVYGEETIRTKRSIRSTVLKPKVGASGLEGFCRDLCSRRDDRSSHNLEKSMFKSGRGMCKT